MNCVLRGETAAPAQASFFGATLIALNKKGGGLRPIAVGCTLRRLVAKCAGACVKEAVGALLAPHQLGFGIPLGVEAAVHASHIFLHNLRPRHLILKLDFRNAFNCLRRDKMIAAVEQLAPELLPLVTCAYSTPSFLFFGEDIIPFSEGVQQGDPLDPLPFCLAIHNLVQQLQSEFNVFFLDDGTLGSSLEEVLEDFNTVERMAGELGLQPNRDKSEVICDDSTTRSAMLRADPGLSVTYRDHATLLGSPIGAASGIQDTILKRTKSPKTLGSRLQFLHAHVHDAFCLIRNALAIPKVLYMHPVHLAMFPRPSPA